MPADHRRPRPRIIRTMTGPHSITHSALDGAADPMTIVRRWPADRPLIMLHSGRLHPRWARWTVLGLPRRFVRCSRDARWSEFDAGAQTGRPIAAAASTGEPLEQMRLLLAEQTRSGDTSRESQTGDGQTGPAFCGGWIGYLSYELGRVIEPAAKGPRTPEDDRDWPLIDLAYCPDALMYDGQARRWFAVGDGEVIKHALDAIDEAGAGDLAEVGHCAGRGFNVGAFTAALDPDAYLRAVRQALDYIAAGDVFQVNLTQRLTATFTGSTRELWRRAVEASQAHYGAYLEMPDGRTVISMSPELLVQVHTAAGPPDRHRHVLTRPIKGTRPASADPRELLDSAKDAAELHMIVDLMRNDLGRVCRFGSIDVPSPRSIESHPTVHHGVGEVTGVLREDVDVAELLRATFPGGSITGAPKIRAMQIIEELEPVCRGPYCGSIGWFGDDGSAQLNIAIRTMMLRGQRPAGRCDVLDGTLDYGAGGGIVADSDPAAEYREMLDKAAVLRRVTAAGAHAAPV